MPRKPLQLDYCRRSKSRDGGVTLVISYDELQCGIYIWVQSNKTRESLCTYCGLFPGERITDPILSQLVVRTSCVIWSQTTRTVCNVFLFCFLGPCSLKGRIFRNVIPINSQEICRIIAAASRAGRAHIDLSISSKYIGTLILDLRPSKTLYYFGQSNIFKQYYQARMHYIHFNSVSRLYRNSLDAAGSYRPHTMNLNIEQFSWLDFFLSIKTYFVTNFNTLDDFSPQDFEK